MEIERVILWGFMASGKTEVGRELARRLGWEHVDLDREIERCEGRTVAEIFRVEGERYFRDLESRICRSVIDRSRMVLSPGGGWITNPGALQLVSPHSLTVWLQVSPDTVLERVQASGAGAVRPLLATSSPAATIRRLLREREPLYGLADLTISTDHREVASVALDIEEAVRRSAPVESSPPKEDAEQG